MYTYIKCERLCVVGHYDLMGDWIAESDHESEHDAAIRAHFLNCGEIDAEDTTATVEKYARALDERLHRLEKQLHDRDTRIKDLEVGMVHMDERFDELERRVSKNRRSLDLLLERFNDLQDSLEENKED